MKLPVTVAVVTAVLLAGLMAIPVMAPASATASNLVAVPGGAGNDLQSYGNVSNLSFQGTTHGGQYFGNVTYGFVVNVTETNTSANTTAVEIEETIGISLGLTYCEGTCAQPVARAVFSYVAWETRDIFANLTDAANVTATVNGTTSVVAATGLLNSAARTRAGVTESAVDTVYPGTNVTNGTTHVYSILAQATYQANSSATFTPALGLFPNGGLSPGESWTATSAFLASGQWSAAWTISVATPHSSFDLNGSAGHTVGPFSGTVTLTGASEPRWSAVGTNQTLQVRYQWSDGDLAFGGPFAVGPSQLPDAWDGNFGGNWGTYHAASAQVSIDAFELNPHGQRAHALAATSVSFSVGVTDTTGQTGTNQSGLSPESLVGTPMSSTDASATGACLQSGSCAASAQGASANGLGTAVLIGIIAGAIIAVVLVGAVLMGRRGARPPVAPPQ